jgi:hypothetical protein
MSDASVAIRADHIGKSDAIVDEGGRSVSRGIGQCSVRLAGLQHELAAVGDEVAPKFYASDKILCTSTLWGRVDEYDFAHDHY